MNLFKRFLPQLVIVFTLCVLSGVGIVRESVVSTAARTNQTPKIIIDSGHNALENTIKTPKNHRQANVEIIPKTRCIGGF